jgi:hypothetical protein
MKNYFQKLGWGKPFLSLVLFFLLLPLFGQNFPISGFDTQPIDAFLGAQGFGRYATGGRGGQVVKVTNLNDSGPGSLRAALETRGPRIVVFDVSGNIALQSPITVWDSDVTIAGQTAPGDGITISNNLVSFYTTKNLIVRFIRFRPGDLAGLELDAGNGRFTENAIFDHCSFSWSVDELTQFYAVKDFTMQWCIVSEALNSSVHSKGLHGFGPLLGGRNVSIHHNIFAHATQRMVMFDHGDLYGDDLGLSAWRGVTDFRNNVIYNWRDRSTHGGDEGNFNVINNYYKPGPATNTGASDFILNPTDTDGDYVYGKFFLQGNFLFGNSTVSSNNWSGARLEDSRLTDRYLGSTMLSSPLAANVYDANPTAQDSYQKALDFSGSSHKRDVVDSRIVNEVRNGTYTFKGSKTGLLGIIDSQRDAGGWPVLKSLSPPLDSDQDGMPDTWEVANKLNPNLSNDREYNLSPYYTDIEVYINSLVDDLVKNQYPTTPLTPGLVLPAANATNVAPVEISFAWSAVPNADTYEVQISKSSTFNGGNITLTNLKNRSLVYPQLDANSTYFWRVRGSRNGINGSYSASRSFQTNSLSAVPGRTLLLQPFTGQDGVSVAPVFTWSKVPNTQSYQIQVSTVSDFSTLMVNQSGLTETSFQSPTLVENQVYYWRVRARNVNGSGSYSVVGNFKTISFTAKADAVVPIRPTNGVLVNPVNIRFDWNPVPGAKTYKVHVSTSSSFSSYVVAKVGITDSFLVIPNLNSNTSYYWRVIAVNDAGEGIFPKTGSFFKTGPFTEAPAQISLNSPVHDSNIFSTSITFSWNASPIAKGYTFQLSTREDFGTFVVNAGNLTTTSRTVSNLQANTQYYWRVWASNEAGNSPISEIRKVRSATYSGMPPATTLSSPSNNSVVGATDILFSWQNQPNTEFYRLEISESTTFGSLVFSRSSIRGTSWMVPSLTVNKTYYWRVRTSNPAGTGRYSEVWKFSTSTGTVSLSQPTLVSPLNAALNQSTSLNFSWNPVSNATSYDVQISETNAFSSISFSQSSISSTSVTFGSLLENKTYFWRVRAKTGSTTSNWSDVWNFSTKGQSVSSPLDAGLVGYWAMEEGSGNRLLDKSANLNHLTLRNTSGVEWTTGVQGRALSLNGATDRYATISHNNSLNIPSGLTISAWVRPNLLHRGTILSKSAGNGFEFWFTINGELEFRLNRTNNGATYKILSNFNYGNSLQKWIHVAATFDGSTCKIYVNGVEDRSVTFNPFSIGTTSGDLVLGALGTTQRWQGLMDEVRLYNRALSREEISLTMQNTGIQEIQSAKTVGHWKMDEGSGSVLVDHSGNGNNGQLQNTTGVFWSNGISGQALNLPGSTSRFALVSHNSTLELPNQLTISAWVKPNILHRGTIVYKSAGNGFELWLDMDGGIEFRLNRTNNGFAYRMRSNYNYSADLGKWIHVSATFDGQTSKLYINGIENVSQTYASPFTIGTTSGDLVIGAMGTVQRMNGSLDDVRIYGQVISASEIQQLANPNSAFRQSEVQGKKGSNEPFGSTDISVGTKESLNVESKLKPILFPNPVIHEFIVNDLWLDEGKVQVWIHDLKGSVLMEQESMVVGNQIQIDIRSIQLKPGNYILILQDKRHREVFRFIKQ